MIPSMEIYMYNDALRIVLLSNHSILNCNILEFLALLLVSFYYYFYYYFLENSQHTATISTHMQYHG